VEPPAKPPVQRWVAPLSSGWGAFCSGLDRVSEAAIEQAWDADGRPSDHGSLGLPPEAGGRLSAALALEAAALAGHGLDGFGYPRDTHMLRNGRDGTILVQRRGDRRIDNPASGQPALVRLDGTGLMVRNGSVSDGWASAAEGVPDRCPGGAAETW